MSDNRKKHWNKIVGIALTLGGAAVVVAVAAGRIPLFPNSLEGQLWMAGGAGLGLLTGLATGISKEGGGTGKLVGFVGTGLVVPLLGGVGALLVTREEVVESFVYEDAQLVEQTTTTITTLSEGSLHPLAVLGAFFLGFAILAIVGVMAGVYLKAGEVRLANVW